MRKLLAYLFGWEYWAFTYGDSTFVRRAKKYHDGAKYVTAMGKHFVIGENCPYDRDWKRVY